LLKILGIERAEIGKDAKMFSMNKHGAKEGPKRVGESFAKSRSNGEDLMGFSESAMTAKADGFIQIDTEHGVRCFKTVQGVQVSSGFFCGEGRSPILRHGTGTKRSESDPQFRPPRDESKSFGSITKLSIIDNI